MREMREQAKAKSQTRSTRTVAAGAPQFATAARAKMKPKYEPEPVKQFQAQPIRRYKNVGGNTSRLSTASSTVSFYLIETQIWNLF